MKLIQLLKLKKRKKSVKNKVNIHDNPLHKIEIHEKECAQRYKNIEERLESGSKRFDKLENMIWGVYPFIVISVVLAKFL
jgi:ABC-type phosphate transport system auxiliary subunit